MRRNLVIFLFIFVAIVLVFFNISLVLPTLDGIERSASQLQLEQARKMRDRIVSAMSLLIGAAQRSTDLISQADSLDKTVLALDPLLKENVGLFKEATVIDNSGKEKVRLNFVGALLPPTSTDYLKESGFIAAKSGQGYFSSVFHIVIFFFFKT